MGIQCETIFETETLTLSHCDKGSNGFWLWDKTRKMNLSMRAKSEREALINALEYYQKRLLEVESAHKELSEKVNAFVSSFQIDEDM